MGSFTDFMNDCDSLNDTKYGITVIKAWTMQTCKLPVLVTLSSIPWSSIDLHSPMRPFDSNVFTSMCQEFCPQGVCISACNGQRGVCSGRCVYHGGVCPGGVYILRPRGRHPKAQKQTPPGPRGRHSHSRWPLKWAVHILLEYILVLGLFSYFS